MLTDDDRKHLRRCVELAREAVDAGDAPFGSVLVGGDGVVLAEDRNRENSVDSTQHPEFTLARWGAAHLSAEERRAATVYTSGEHCTMCSAAHGWAGLGRIVYAVSTQQLLVWLDALGAGGTSPVRPYAIQDIAPNVTVDGPAPDLADEIQALHTRFHTP